MVIKHMRKQCVPGALSPHPPPRLETRDTSEMIYHRGGEPEQAMHC